MANMAFLLVGYGDGPWQTQAVGGHNECWPKGSDVLILEKPVSHLECLRG